MFRSYFKSKIFEAQQTPSAEEGIIRGDQFTKELAKDSETREMIDRAEELKTKIIDEDVFIAQEINYEELVQKAEDHLIEERDRLEEYYSMEIQAEKLPEMLTLYNSEQNVDIDTRRLEEEALQKSIEDFEYSQRVLQEIDQRKLDIVEEVDKHVSGINKHREDAGMEEYSAAKMIQPEIRSSRTINDLRKPPKEEIVEQSRDQVYEKVNIEIESLSEIAKESVISPEFIAKAKAGEVELIKIDKEEVPVERYQELAKQQVEQMVYQELASAEEGIIRDDQFMKELAKDSETREMIERAEELKTKIIDEDVFIAQEINYEELVQKAEDHLIEERDRLEEYYSMEIQAEKLPEMLTLYNSEQNVDIDTRRLEEEALQKSIEDYEYNQRVLQEIDQRKVDIVEEVDKHISVINEHREKSGIQEYISASEPEAVARRASPPVSPNVVEPSISPNKPAKIQPKMNQVGVRSKRTIDELRRK